MKVMVYYDPGNMQVPCETVVPLETLVNAILRSQIRSNDMEDVERAESKVSRAPKLRGIDYKGREEIVKDLTSLKQHLFYVNQRVEDIEAVLNA